MSSQDRQRTRIGKGIYRDQRGIAATVKGGTLQREKRFESDASIRAARIGRTRRGTLKLTDAGLAALRHFAELDCWGPFSNSSMIKSFHRACKTAGVPEARVYDQRHSYATEMYRRTGDPKATAEMLMHAPSSRMMDRYTIAGVEPRLRLARSSIGEGAGLPGSTGWQYRAEG